MKHWTPRALLLGLAITGSTFALADDAKPNYAVTNTFKVVGVGGWDYAIVDPATHYLYQSRQSHTQVIDTSTGAIVADLPHCGAHGIALVPNLNKGFTSDGKADTVTAFDLKSNTILYTVPTGHNPDCTIYDPSSKKVFAFDGRSDDSTVIDPAAKTPNLSVVAHIPLDGKPEFAAADGAGHVYVNIENKNEIQDIDTASLTIAHTWPIDGDGPSGLAIDPDHHHLFAGCDAKMVVVDTTTGKTIATPAIGDGVDACGFDAGTGEAFASCGDGTLSVIKETSPGKFETVQTVTTKPGARTMALDPSTHTIYLASAEMLPKQQGERRPKMKPDTFAILVVSQSASAPTTQPAGSLQRP
jgi:DNA-binding beta-propeller fold protein YncE